MGEEEVEKAKKYLWRTLGTLRGAFLSFRIPIFLELEETGCLCTYSVAVETAIECKQEVWVLRLASAVTTGTPGNLAEPGLQNKGNGQNWFQELKGQKFKENRKVK